MFRQENPDVLMRLHSKALLLGASDFNMSNRKNKRFYVVYKGTKIHFGSKSGQTFLEHKDVKKKQAWLRRHGMIKNKNEEYVILLKESPSFWSHRLLW